MLELDIVMKVDSRYPFDRKMVRNALKEVLIDHNVNEKVTISLSVVGERKIRELERQFFDRDEVTDVLSFPLEEGEKTPNGEDRNLGDIVICYPQAKRQAMQWNKRVDEEVIFLACHGLLHLLGVHHD